MDNKQQTSKALGYIGIDQWGKTYAIGNNPPRKTLCEMLGRTHAKKLYDREDKHVGYLIAGCWIRVYELHEWTEDNK